MGKLRKVAIIGAGITKFGEHWEKSFRELGTEAAIKAVENSNIDGKEIEGMYIGCMASGRFVGQEHIGALVADQLGLNPIPSARVEAACASGGLALRTGYLSIASGEHDVVAVGGIEKMTEVTTADAGFALGGAGDQETELFHGATFPALYALLARVHMNEFGTTEEQMAAVSVKNHKNAVHNPIAQYRKEISIEQVMNSGYVATPLKLLDCSPITDGAAAVILAEVNVAKKLCEQPVEILGSAHATDSLALMGRKSLTELNATKMASKELFRQTGLGVKDIDLAEVHDCFSIAEILATEDIGFFRKGEGGKAAEEGKTALDGEIPINTSGGLKSCGHPVGATGVKQAAEIFQQLRGEAQGRQVSGAEIGITHNVGGSGATCIMHAFKRL